ncbi:hypothetical protein [Rhodopseudomonas sp. B29]|uniref:hypothetical protein n=1 Tax=Rhodopseudomonas sp. B29 TaxID=95607 RepID=UPI00034657F2|nr:hypothetical protein [Rhodopseudomonas sp. B29]
MTVSDYDRPSSTRWHSGLGGFLLREWPYLLILMLSLFGVAYTSFSQTSIYWVILAPLIGIVCIFLRWREARSNDQHMFLVLSQVLHWAAVLAAMELMSLEVTRQVSGVASALGILTLLALGTFTAGLHIRAWKIAIVGVILGVSVPAIALLEQSALLIVLVVGLILAALVPFFWTKSRAPRAPSHPLYEPPARPAGMATAPLTPTPEPPLYQAPVTAAEPVVQKPLFDPVDPPSAKPPAATPSEVTQSISVLGEDASTDADATDKPPLPDNVRSISGGR